MECRSHLDVDDNDPTVGQKFSTETLRRGDAGRGPIPSSLHGAPETAEESREVLARLKRMAGFESQDFDPGVRSLNLNRLLASRAWRQPSGCHPPPHPSTKRQTEL